MRDIYILTTEAGGWTRDTVASFAGRSDLMQYAEDVLCCTSIVIGSRDTIGDLCDKLADQGLGRGSRSHRRISRADAVVAIRQGANNLTGLIA
jgi:hypothetical protein